MDTEKEYADNGGSKCPVCKTGDIEAGGIDMEGTYIYQDVWCLCCKAKWVDVYTLTGYTDMEIGNTYNLTQGETR